MCIRDRLLERPGYTGWAATCGRHRGPSDAPGTSCRKTRQFKGEEDKQHVVLMPKAWILAGRQFSPDQRSLGHKALEPEHIELLPDAAETIEQQLAEALAEESWRTSN
eukprot:10997666-Alexandrium_andersonii.AAC.1